MIKIFGKGAVPRSRIVEESLVEYPISLASDCRNDDGTALSYSGGIGRFKVDGDGWSDGTLALLSYEASQATCYLSFEFSLPPEYVDDRSIKMAVRCRAYAMEALESAHIDAQVYKLDNQGDVAGSNLYTGGQKSVAESWATQTFDITSSGLVTGDKFRVLLKSYTKSAAPGGTWITIGSIRMQLDIKG